MSMMCDSTNIFLSTGKENFFNSSELLVIMIMAMGSINTPLTSPALRELLPEAEEDNANLLSKSPVIIPIYMP